MSAQGIFYLIGVIISSGHGFQSATFAAYSESQCQPWSFVTMTNTSGCHCYTKESPLREAVLCTDEGTLLQFGYCMTNEEGNGTFLVECPYFDYKAFNVSNLEYIQLPEHLSELNGSMCDPLNREGS